MQITVEIIVSSSLEKAFAVFTDFPNAATIVSAIDQVDMLTPGPVGVGTRFTETRTMMGKSASEDMTVSVFNPSQRCVLTAFSNGTHYETAFTFAKSGDATLATVTFTATPKTFLSRILNALMGPLLGKSIRKMLEQDMLDRKKAAETA